MAENYSHEDELKNFVINTEEESKPVSNGIITSAPPLRMPGEKSSEQLSLANRIGWINIPIEDLPTRGMFYPKGSEIVIRAASSGEIRHWSTLQENDLSRLDDMLNYVIERCVTIKFGGNRLSSWKDIKEIDRFYLLLAIRELTFINGENKLQVPISETKKLDVTKDMVDFITYDERLFKYYNPEKLCFSLKFKSGKVIDIFIPSIGVSQWIKNYVIRKQQSQQPFDEDFINFAPFVIPDWKGLNDLSYEQIIEESFKWSPLEISAISHIRKLFIDTVNPVIKFNDESGAERTAPLTFQGGIKSILLVSSPLDQLE